MTFASQNNTYYKVTVTAPDGTRVAKWHVNTKAEAQLKTKAWKQHAPQDTCVTTEHQDHASVLTW
jgi:hypothetical protein